MLTVTVRGLGLSVDTVPGEIFALVQDYSVNNGAVNFQVEETNRQAVEDVIKGAVDIPIQVNRIGTGVLIIEPRQPTQPTVNAPAVGPGQATEVAEGVVEGEVGEEIGDEPDGDPDDEEECHAEERAPQDLTRFVRTDDGDIDVVIATHLQGQVTNRAKLLVEKNTEFNRLWTRLINLKREIEDLSSDVHNHPLTENLKRQVRELQDADNLVEEIFFSRDRIVVRTSELTTTVEMNGHKRRIGRMEFHVLLKALMGNPDNMGIPVLTFNRDRRYRVGDYTWECGHVKSDGDVCFGNAWEMLFHAFASRDLHAIVDIMVRFVQQPNPADAYGTAAQYWPIAE